MDDTDWTSTQSEEVAAIQHKSRHTLDDGMVADLAQACNVSPESIEDIYACTAIQLDTMAETALSSRTSMFQFVFALGITIDEDRLVRAINEVVAKHATLRTRIVDHPKLGFTQVVLTQGCAVRQPRNVDLHKYVNDNESQSMGFGLELSSIAIVEHKLVLAMHHAVMDHAALTLLMTDIFAIYNGETLISRPPYKDFVVHCLNIDRSTAANFWSQRFRGHPAIWPKIPTAHLAQATETCYKDVAVNETVSDDTITHIPSYIEAAFALALGTYADSDNIVFGLILSGRNVSSSGLGSTVGPTIAIVPVQVSLQGRLSVETVVQERTLARRQLQTNPALHVGLPQIRLASEAAGIASKFQAVLNIRPSLADTEAASDMVEFDHVREPPAPFALCLSCNLSSGRRKIFLEAQFDSAVMQERQVLDLLTQVTYNLDLLMQADGKKTLKALPMLNPEDRSQIFQWNFSLPPAVELCLHTQFEERAKRQPDALAVDAPDGRATYAELNSLSTRVAHELLRRDVKSGGRVPFIFEKSMYATVAILATMKVGAACVPIGYQDPHSRKLQLIKRVGATLIVTSTSQVSNSAGLAENIFALGQDTLDQLPDTEDHIVPEAAPDDLAVILFTSGSTGVPKGVLLEHRCLSTSLSAVAETLDWKPGRRVLQFAAYVWDLSIGETFAALLFGGCLCVPSEDDRTSSLTEFLHTKNVDMAVFTPSVLRTLSRDDLPNLRTVISAGEAISHDTIETWGHGDVKLFNGWGPCETSVLSSIALARSNAPFPESIGHSVGCALWLANPDDSDALVPIGSTGEIYVEGSSVARGYLEDARGQGNGFVQRPAWAPDRSYGPSRFFRTGDLGRYNPDGGITYLGRRDHQVKIRSQRFELGDVEAAVSSYAIVRAVVVTTRISAGRTELVAVMSLLDHRLPTSTTLGVLTGEAANIAAASVAELKSFVQSRLPSYMVPTIWIAVEQMPQTMSAKLDRVRVRDWVKEQKLAHVKTESHATAQVLTAPISDCEKAFQETWAASLRLPSADIGRESVFLQLGGDSIRAMQAAGLMRRKGYSVSTISLLRRDALSAIAQAVATISLPTTVPNTEPTKVAQPSIVLPPSYTRERDVEFVCEATDVQAEMLATGQRKRNGYHVDFLLDFEPHLDPNRLKAACHAIVQHHAILRTVFVQHGSHLYQVVLRDNSRLPQLVTIESDSAMPPSVDFGEGSPMVHFFLLVNNEVCTSLRISLHHALYDAYSLNLILADLHAAYSSKPLSTGLQFHTWCAKMRAQDRIAPNNFWREELRGSSMSRLIPAPDGPICGSALDGHLEISAPLRVVSTNASGTPASVLRAAWALLLSHALQKDDVVFGEVSAARLASIGETTDVRGPCVNNIPVRADVSACTSLRSLIGLMQSKYERSLPHHQVTFSEIIRECTNWPSWTRFSTSFVYQPEGLLKNVLHIGGASANLSHQGTLGDSSDLWVIASPQDVETVRICLQFRLDVLPREQVQWIAQCLESILRAISDNADRTMQDVRDHLQSTLGAYKMPEIGTTRTSPGEKPVATSEDARRTVDVAWEETGLLMTNNEHLTDRDGDNSMAACGGTIITALLLSKFYGRCGYDVPVEEIVRRPTRALQAGFLDEKGKTLSYVESS